MRKDSLTTRLLLITVAVIATYAAIVHFGFQPSRVVHSGDSNINLAAILSKNGAPVKKSIVQ